MQDWFDKAAGDIEAMASSEKGAIFPLTTVSPIQTGKRAESIDGPDPHEGFGTKNWFEEIGKVVSHSQDNHTVPTPMKYHKMQSVQRASQELRFELNREVFARHHWRSR